MEQVLTNLIDNAIRHTNAGGHVTLVIDTKNNGLIFEVQDSGAGIPEEDIPFLFDRFYKADKARTRGKKGGTGLRLAIAKILCKAMMGKLLFQVLLERNYILCIFTESYNLNIRFKS